MHQRQMREREREREGATHRGRPRLPQRSRRPRVNEISIEFVRAPARRAATVPSRESGKKSKEGAEKQEIGSRAAECYEGCFYALV